MKRWLTVGIMAVAFVACSAPMGRATIDSGGTAAPGARSQEPKRVIAAIRGAPNSIAQLRTQPTTGSVPGLDAVAELVSAGLVHQNDSAQVLPQLALEVPSLENGQWKVF